LAVELSLELLPEPLLELESEEELSVAPTLALVVLEESLVSLLSDDLDSLESLPPFSAGGLGRP